MKRNINISYLIKLLSVFIFLIIVYRLFYAFKFPIVAQDTGYFLAVARDLYNGAQYFTEIASSYNPLAIVIVGIPYLFSEAPDIRVFLLINILLIVGTATIIYHLLNENLANSKPVNFLFTLLFLLGSIVLEGKYVLLEPASVFFQLFALYLYLKNKSLQRTLLYFVVGSMIALSFLSKQFGLFLILPIVVDIIIYNKKYLKKLFYLITGLIMPIFILYIYYAYYNVSISQYLLYILGRGVEFDIGVGTGISITLKTLLTSAGLFVIFNLYFLLIPLVFFKEKNINLRNSVIFIVSALSSISVLYFASYLHYYQYLLPFFIILSAYAFQYFKYYTLQVIFVLLVFFSVIITTAYSIKNNITVKNRYESQQNSTLELQKIIPKNSKVYIVGPSKAYYFLGQYKSINLNNIGYTFPSYFYSTTIYKNAPKDGFIIVNDKSLEEYRKILNNFSHTEVLIDNKKYNVIKIL